MTSKQEVLAWEERWSRPAGIAALAAIVLLVASLIIGSQIGGGNGTAEQLQNVDQDSATQLISSILLALGFVLLVGPLYFLFRAARARSDRVRRQLVGVVIAGPLFFAAASVVSGSRPSTPPAPSSKTSSRRWKGKTSSSTATRPTKRPRRHLLGRAHSPALGSGSNSPA